MSEIIDEEGGKEMDKRKIRKKRKEKIERRVGKKEIWVKKKDGGRLMRKKLRKGVRIEIERIKGEKGELDEVNEMRFEMVEIERKDKEWKRERMNGVK